MAAPRCLQASQFFSVRKNYFRVASSVCGCCWWGGRSQLAALIIQQLTGLSCAEGWVGRKVWEEWYLWWMQCFAIPQVGPQTRCNMLSTCAKVVSHLQDSVAISYLVLPLVLNTSWQWNTCVGSCCWDFFFNSWYNLGCYSSCKILKEEFSCEAIVRACRVQVNVNALNLNKQVVVDKKWS